MMLDYKMMVWTWTTPLTPSGSPDILRKLMLNFKGENILYISGKNENNLVKYEHPIKSKNYAFIDRWYLKIGPVRLKSIFDIFIKTPLLTIIGIYKVIKFKPDFIFTIYVLPEWIFSAYLISKITGKPLVYYCHDPHKEKYKFRPKWLRNINAYIEKKTLNYGNVIALYEGLANLYRKQYNIDVIVIPHSGIEKVSKEINFSLELSQNKCVGFAGSIYGNNIDVIKNMLVVTNMLKLPVILFGKYDEATLKIIQADKHHNLTIRFIKEYGTLIDELSKADLLFLPLSFIESSKMPRESLQYVLPTKAIDYLIADKPILVNCPKDFEMYNFFQKNKAAYLLPTNEVKDLQLFLEQFIAEKLDEIPKANTEKALSNFDKVTIDKRFVNYIKTIIN